MDYINEIENGMVNIGQTDPDIFSGGYTVPCEGHKLVTLKNWEVVPSKKIYTEYAGKIEDTGRETKAYIALEYETESGERVPARIYEKGVAFFMGAIACQTAGITAGRKLSDVLKYVSTHKIDIWVSFSNKYGAQVSYYAPREEEI